MRVITVDDSAFMRKAITQMLKTDPAIDVVAIGKNGREAVELCKKHKPDLITMDIEMPEVDGLTALRQIMRDCPTSVIMLSSLTTAGSQAALTALRIGAVDFLAKDSSNFSLSIGNIQEELLTKVRAHAGSKRFKRGQTPSPSASSRNANNPATPSANNATQPPKFSPSDFDLICIGSSTGGPPAVEKIITQIPATLKQPVVIAQHMPKLFTETFAQRLDRISPLNCVHAEDGIPLFPGYVYVAPGGQHTHIERVRLNAYRLRVNDKPKEAIYKPSVDALLASASDSLGRRALGVVLTGIGQDGMLGATSLKDAGGKIIAQEQSSCVVYGMPRAIVDNNLAHAVLDPDQIGQLLAALAPAGSAASATPQRAG